MDGCWVVGGFTWGVINAGLTVGLSKDAPIGIVHEDFALAPWLGLLRFMGDRLVVRMDTAALPAAPFFEFLGAL